MKSAKFNMRGPTYRYNTETCRYEPTRMSSKGAITYALGLAVTATFFLAGLLILHDFIVNTDQEIAYHKENRAIEKNQALLTAELQEVEATLGLLKDKDKKLHQKFFTPVLEEPEQHQRTTRKHDILLSDAQSFREVATTLEAKTLSLIQSIETTNHFFATKTKQSLGNLDLVESLPLLQPVANLQAEQLLSGYGKRINPFHKGLYNHTGIDIALPRGTEIIATATGKVITTKHSSVQAGYGNYVEIDHGHGLVTRYAHLEEIHVRVGQQVTKGSVIATSGNSGGSIAPHLHYEISRNGKTVDPISYMIEGVNPEIYHRLRYVGQQQNQSLD